MRAHSSGDDVIRWFGATRAMGPVSYQQTEYADFSCMHTIFLGNFAVVAMRIAADDGPGVPEPREARGEGPLEPSQPRILAVPGDSKISKNDQKSKLQQSLHGQAPQLVQNARIHGGGCRM